MSRRRASSVVKSSGESSKAIKMPLSRHVGGPRTYCQAALLQRLKKTYDLAYSTHLSSLRVLMLVTEIKVAITRAAQEEISGRRLFVVRLTRSRSPNED